MPAVGMVSRLLTSTEDTIVLENERLPLAHHLPWMRVAMRVLRSGEFIDRRTRSYYPETVTWFAAAALVLALSTHLGLRWPGLAVSMLLFVLGTKSFDHWERWFFGQREEIPVKDALRSLPEDYFLLNDPVLPDGRGHSDHFLIGPDGLFVVEAEGYSIVRHLQTLQLDQTEKELLIETIPIGSEEGLSKTGPLQW
jgi:hypothetical protein